MDIGEAVRLLKSGLCVMRSGWNGKGMHLELLRPELGSGLDFPFVALCNAQGLFVPWNASQEDLLAEDWEPYPQADGAECA